MSQDTTIAADGVPLPDDGLPELIVDAGSFTTITKIYRGVTYTQTITYIGNDTVVSGWLPQ